MTTTIALKKIQSLFGIFGLVLAAFLFFIPQIVSAATATLTASPATVAVGEQITISWSSSDAWKCVGSGFNTGNATNGSVTVTPTTSGSKNYSIICYDETPACSLQLLETTIDDGPAGNTCSSIISTSPLGSCTPNGGFCTTSSSQGNGFYQNRSWQCLGPCTVASASDTVTVNDPPPPPAPEPDVTISVSPTTVTAGNSVLVSWNANNASSCDGTNFSTNGATSGSVSVTPTGDTTFSVTCDSTVQTTGTPGTWELHYTDVTDLWCPISSTRFNQVYSVFPNCPTSSITPSCPPGSTFGCTHTNTGDPTGLACVGSERCKLNSNTSCNIVSEIYKCNGGSEPAQITKSASIDYNRPPNPPTIDGPTTGTTGTTYTFTLTATDPDGDTIRYRLDWDPNSGIDQNAPGSGYVSSGTSRNVTRSWGSPGTYTFRARTQDVHGAQSGFTTHTIVISDPGPTPECSDGIDNDGDGHTDWPADPDCSGGGGTTESPPPPSPECSDGIENDSDGLIDYPNDPGCDDPNDDTEDPNPQCSDGIDNDGDGLTDYPNDPDCSSPGGAGGGSEGSGPPASQCSDGIDNDGDGLIDYPADSGCSGSGDNTESTPPQCSDTIDNDGDGLADYPADPGCSSPSDNDEFNPPPEASLSLNISPGSVVRAGTRVTVSWSASNVQSCAVNGTNGDNWGGSSGNRTSSPLTTETTFVLNCIDLNGETVSLSQTIKILPSFEET